MRWFLIGALLFGVAAGACAQEKAFYDHMRFGFNRLQASGNSSSDVYGFNVELPFYTASNSQTSLSLGCSSFSEVGIVSAFINTRHAPARHSGFIQPYVGAGFGVEYAGMIAPNDFDNIYSCSFVWQTMTGVNIGRNLFAELKYQNGGRSYNTGMSFGIGTRF